MVWLLRLLSNWADRLARFLLVPIGIGFILVVFLGVLTRHVFQAPIITSVELVALYHGQGLEIIHPENPSHQRVVSLPEKAISVGFHAASGTALLKKVPVTI